MLSMEVKNGSLEAWWEIISLQQLEPQMTEWYFFQILTLIKKH